MENSSKALTIAGGVLIAILVTTLLVLGLSRLRSYQNTRISATKNQQTSQFNSQFESYNKKVVTGYEMISLGRMAEDTNKRLTAEGYVEVNIYMKVKYDEPVNDKCIIQEYVEAGNNKESNDYYDVIAYTRHFKNLENNSRVQKIYNQLKKFKEAYFKCDKVEYDDKVTDKLRGSGRVIAMYFSEITKKE